MLHICVPRFDVTENLTILQNSSETQRGLTFGKHEATKKKG